MCSQCGGFAGELWSFVGFGKQGTESIHLCSTCVHHCLSDLTKCPDISGPQSLL